MIFSAYNQRKKEIFSYFCGVLVAGIICFIIILVFRFNMQILASISAKTYYVYLNSAKDGNNKHHHINDDLSASISKRTQSSINHELQKQITRYYRQQLAKYEILPFHQIKLHGIKVDFTPETTDNHSYFFDLYNSTHFADSATPAKKTIITEPIFEIEIVFIGNLNLPAKKIYLTPVTLAKYLSQTAIEKLLQQQDNSYNYLVDFNQQNKIKYSIALHHDHILQVLMQQYVYPRLKINKPFQGILDIQIKLKKFK